MYPRNEWIKHPAELVQCMNVVAWLARTFSDDPAVSRDDYRRLTMEH